MRLPSTVARRGSAWRVRIFPLAVALALTMGAVGSSHAQKSAVRPDGIYGFTVPRHGGTLALKSIKGGVPATPAQAWIRVTKVLGPYIGVSPSHFVILVGATSILAASGLAFVLATGPVDVATLQKLALRGSLTRYDEISPDGCRDGGHRGRR